MRSILAAFRGLVKKFVLLVIVVVVGILGLAKKGTDVLPPPYSQKVHVCLHYLEEGTEKIKKYVGAGEAPEGEGEAHHEAHKLVVTSPKIKDVTITEKFVCQIHSQKHVEIHALEGGYLESISVKEGQTVKKGDPMFKILPTLYRAKLDAELAEAKLARLEWEFTKKLSDSRVVSANEVFLLEAKMNKANAKADLAAAELNFTNVQAPFDGIVDKLQEREGSLISEGDILTTLSDNSVMWVYFNVPEKRYLRYRAEVGDNKLSPKIELELADHNKFSQVGKIGAIEANFNHETGNIPFRADFPNPGGLLRHGQTGTILLSHVVHEAVVIPQRSTFENLAKRYVYVVGEDGVVRQHGISIQNELEDVYVLAEGILDPKSKIVLEGIRQVRDGEKVEYDFREPEEVLADAKYRAE